MRYKKTGHDAVKILVTCPPMIGMMEELKYLFVENGMDYFCPQVLQTLSESELVDLVPEYTGWIIGDDPATRNVLGAGSKGKLKAAVKWGIGVDNVDFEAAAEYGIPVQNTPGMFGQEVADVAISYVVGLARETFLVDREIREGKWPKPNGISLRGKTVGLVGYGDVGKNVAKRLLAMDMNIIAYDPGYKSSEWGEVRHTEWPNQIQECDFIVMTCSLNPNNFHMLDDEALEKTKHGVRIVNVARGPLICEEALVESLERGKVYSVALDVFETEPLPLESSLRKFDRCIFGSHNASNTSEAVCRASEKAVKILVQLLNQ